jgi:hypothetical protein
VPDRLPGVAVSKDNLACSDHEVLLCIPDVARFLVREGSEILVDTLHAADPSMVRIFLLGSVFGILCHQRGILPLHSAAIDTASGCIAFVGESGSGKSTLAAALFARGHQVITDDVSFLGRDDADNIVTWPGVARIRLWEDALTGLGVHTSTLEREARAFNKYLLPVSTPKNVFAPRQISRIYRLGATSNRGQKRIRRVQGALAIELLMQNVYRLNYAKSMGRTPDIFQFCAEMAARIPIFDFSRPFEFAAMGEGLNLLESHFQAA